MPEHRIVFSTSGTTSQFRSSGVSHKSPSTSDYLNIIPGTALIIMWRDRSSPHIHHLVIQAGVISLLSAQMSHCCSKTCNLQSRGWGQFMFSWGEALNHSNESATIFSYPHRKGLWAGLQYKLRAEKCSWELQGAISQHRALWSHQLYQREKWERATGSFSDRLIAYRVIPALRLLEEECNGAVQALWVTPSREPIQAGHWGGS